MSVKTSPEPTGSAGPPRENVDAGVIEDARARQRRHRIIGAALLAGAIAAGTLAIGFGGGGSGNGQTGNDRGGASGPSAHFRLLHSQQQPSTTRAGYRQLEHGL